MFEATVTPKNLRGSKDGALRYQSGHLLTSDVAPCWAPWEFGNLEIGEHSALFWDEFRIGISRQSTKKNSVVTLPQWGAFL